MEIQNATLKYNFLLLLRSDKKISHVNCLCSRPFLHTALGYQPEMPKITSLWTKLATKLLTSRKNQQKDHGAAIYRLSFVPSVILQSYVDWISDSSSLDT